MNSGNNVRVLSVVGARPNFMKVAPIIKAIGKHNDNSTKTQIHHVLVHTGQHYDAMMSDQFFSDLDLPKPDVHLGVAAGTQACQIAEILQKLEKVLLAENPDVVLVVGDVTSTIASALATVKVPLSRDSRRPLLAHVEAGLRSFDREMPEEINRIVTDHLSDLLFVTEESGITNLRNEGIPSEKIFLVGNTMIDSVLTFRDRADASPILTQLGLRANGNNGRDESIEPYALLTLHRPSNVDNPSNFQNILSGITEVSRNLPVIFPVHPRSRKRIEEFGLTQYFENGHRHGIRLIDPLGYIDFLSLMKSARLVLTDSGGIQEETTCLRIPCVTLRDNTERPATVHYGTNVIAGTSASGIRQAIARQLEREIGAVVPEKWDGKAAQRILAVVLNSVAGYKQP